MFVAAIQCELHFPMVHSLKEKRAVIRPIIDGLRNRFNVSVSETDHQDLWQRATIGVAIVGASVGHVEDVLENIERFVWSFPEISVLSMDRSWLE
jgi:uncharacterized protein